MPDALLKKVKHAHEMEKEMYYTFGTRMDIMDKEVPLAEGSAFPFQLFPTTSTTTTTWKVFKGDSGELQGYLKEIQREFQGSFKDVLRKFQGC